jgi:hypothetical protein
LKLFQSSTGHHSLYFHTMQTHTVLTGIILFCVIGFIAIAFLYGKVLASRRRLLEFELLMLVMAYAPITSRDLAYKHDATYGSNIVPFEVRRGLRNAHTQGWVTRVDASTDDGPDWSYALTIAGVKKMNAIARGASSY